MIAAALGGHVAEVLVFGEMSTGPQNDIERATNLARKMVCEYGMSDRLGPVALGHKEELVFLGREIGEQKNYSEKVAESIDEEVRRLIDQGYERAESILKEHMEKLHKIAEYLIQNETVEGETLERLFQGLPPEEPTATAPPSAAAAPPTTTPAPPPGQPRFIPGPATSG